MPTATTVFVGGDLLTMNPTMPTAAALAVADGRILTVGSRAEVEAAVRGNAEWIDLHGRTLLPGFIDAHGHFPDSGLNALYRVDLSSPPLGDCVTLSDLFDRLATKAATTAAGEWVLGALFDQTGIAERRFPTRAELDGVSRRHPILVLHASGHAGAANTLALCHRGGTRATLDPVGGRFGHDPDGGAPDGLLDGIPALGAMGDTDFALDAQRFRRAFAVAAGEYLANGVTLAQNAWATAKLLPRFAAIAHAGDAEIDVMVLPAGELEPALSAGRPGIDFPSAGRLRLGPRKLFADGAFQTRTAFLSHPYHRVRRGDPACCGHPMVAPAEFRRRFLALHEAGLQIHTHANGDAAADRVLDALEDALDKHPRTDHRHTLIHGQTLRDDQLDRIAGLGASVSFFSAHVYFWGDRHYAEFLGPERAARINPARSAVRRGVRFTLHNDTPVTPTRPLHLMWCAVNRLTAAGRRLGAEQCITPGEALRAHTIDAAWQVFLEHERGSLEPGKRADLVILSENPLHNLGGLKDIRVEETIVAGATAYRHP